LIDAETGAVVKSPHRSVDRYSSGHSITLPELARCVADRLLPAGVLSALSGIYLT